MVWQRTRVADEKLRRLIRKPERLDDEKPETWPVMANWGFTGSACMLRAVVCFSYKTGRCEGENERGRIRGRECLDMLGPDRAKEKG